MIPFTLLLAFLPGEGQPAPYVAELAALHSVGKEGLGNEAASQAWAKLVAGGSNALLPLLGSFDKATPAAQNWLRTAIDAIAEGEKQAGRKFDGKALTGFVTDVQRHPAARRIAFELLKDQDPTDAENILVSFTNDPSLELRRDAIAKNLEHLKDVASLLKLFAAARDKDQVEDIARKLKEQKAEANITKHFGYITQWDVIGPFDNKEGKGFNAILEPEKTIVLDKKYGDMKLVWLPAQSSATYGTIDLNTAIGKHKDAVGYAVAQIDAKENLTGEIRVASQNAVKFFVNGTEVFAREEYHHGTKMDQHIASIKLKAGPNIILLKVCQNDMSQPWAQAWGFAARICDSTGGALPATQYSKGVPIESGNLAPAPKKD